MESIALDGFDAIVVKNQLLDAQISESIGADLKSRKCKLNPLWMFYLQNICVLQRQLSDFSLCLFEFFHHHGSISEKNGVHKISISFWELTVRYIWLWLRRCTRHKNKQFGCVKIRDSKQTHSGRVRPAKVWGPLTETLGPKSLKINLTDNRVKTIETKDQWRNKLLWIVAQCRD